MGSVEPEPERVGLAAVVAILSGVGAVLAAVRLVWELAPFAGNRPGLWLLITATLAVVCAVSWLVAAADVAAGALR